MKRLQSNPIDYDRFSTRNTRQRESVQKVVCIATASVVAVLFYVMWVLVAI